MKLKSNICKSFFLLKCANSDLIAQLINPHEVKCQYLREITYTVNVKIAKDRQNSLKYY